MGREIRRVPLGWEHPRDHRGEYISLYDKTFEQAVAEWQADVATYPSMIEALRGGEASPDPDSYRPEWPADAVLGYAVYQTVSEGTPITPTFATKDELVDHLVAHGTDWDHGVGWRRSAAEQFVRDEWAPSFIVTSDARGHEILDGARDADLIHEARA